MAAPDGAPVAWLLRRIGHKKLQRIPGPDLMWDLCRACADEGVSIYLYGGTESALALLEAAIRRSFPTLRIAGKESPPFRPLTADEDSAAIARINASGAGVLFVGLGCPRQEQWMYGHHGHVRCVMLGVGAAFDFHAGTLRRAPPWMQARM